MPVESVKKEQIDLLRSSLPANVTATVMKNTLMKLAVTNSSFVPIVEFLKKENMFLFIPEGLSPMVLKSLRSWYSETNLLDSKFAMKGCVFENQSFTGESMLEVMRLPSRSLLLGKLVGSLKRLPYQLVDILQRIPPESLSNSTSVIDQDSSLSNANQTAPT